MIKIVNEGPIMNTTEKYRIYRANQEWIHLNDGYTNNRTPISEIFYNHYKNEKKRIRTSVHSCRVDTATATATATIHEAPHHHPPENNSKQENVKKA
jgi:hypothetical protein